VEERLLSDPDTHQDHSPEARRKRALQHRIEAYVSARARLFAVVKRVWTGAYYDGFIHAGNLAYMALLALFPFFIVITAVVSAIGEPAQRDAAVDAPPPHRPGPCAGVVGPAEIESAPARWGSVWWLGGLTGIWTTGSLLETIRDILHRAYGTPQTQAFWRTRLFSTGVIFVAVILLLFSLFAQVAIVAAETAVTAWFPKMDQLFSSLSFSRLATAIVLYASIFLLFVSLTPETYRGRAYPKWPGALLVTLWWVATVVLLPPVLRLFFTYDLTYGSLAGVMIALFFFWLVGLGIVAGAELNAALAVTPEERAELGRIRRGGMENGEQSA